MASLGDVGFQLNTPMLQSGLPFYGLDKRGTQVTMSATSSVPGSFISLFRNSVLNDRTRSNSSTGVWTFYDMDDSLNQVYTIASFTQDGPTGELWQATVSGATVVVTKLFDTQRATALAFA